MSGRRAENESWCRDRLKQSAEREEAGDLEGAIEVLQSGYQRCGDGLGFLREIGSAYWLKDQPDQAATYYQREVSSPRPSEGAFFGLAKMFMRVLPAHREQIAHMGTTAAAPIYVPAISFEYRWINTFACEGDRVTVLRQSAAVGKDGRGLDRIEYQCVSQPKRDAYFDAGDDPQEKALRDHLTR